MSAPEQKKTQPRTNGKPPVARNDYQEVVELMKRMGSRDGFDPIPPDQHAWAMDEDQPPLNRIWGFMCAHTIHWGHRKEYAISKEDRVELHLEHIAKALGMDEGNVRHYWRIGVERGLWRNGTKAEGSRRLYLCGTVRRTKPAAAPGDDAEKVCTNLFEKLEPLYIREYLKGLPVQRQRDFWARDVACDRLLKDAQAELTAAFRIIADRYKNTIYDEFGVNKIRESHKTNLTPEEVTARDARLGSIVPNIERYVHTLRESAQSDSESEYDPNSQAILDLVQPLTARATLLGVENPLEKDLEACVRTPEPLYATSETPHRDGEKSDGLLPAPKQPAAAKAQAHSAQNPQSTKRNGEETKGSALKNPGNDAKAKKPARGDATDERLGQYLASHPPADTAQADVLYAGIPELQERYPDAAFSTPKFSALGKGDQTTAKLILAALDGDDAAEFLQFVEKRCERGDVQSVGLFLDLAKQFHREAPDRAKKRAEWEAEEQRQAGITARARERELRTARSTLASKDPTVTDRDRELAREVIDEADGKSKGATS